MQKIEISTNDVLTTASALEKSNNNIQTKFNEIDRAMKNVNNAWNSPSKDTAFNQYSYIKKRYQNQSTTSRHTIIMNYIVSLRNTVVDNYKKVEDKNTKIADAYK